MFASCSARTIENDPHATSSTARRYGHMPMRAAPRAAIRTSERSGGATGAGRVSVEETLPTPLTPLVGLRTGARVVEAVAEPHPDLSEWSLHPRATVRSTADDLDAPSSHAQILPGVPLRRRSRLDDRGAGDSAEPLRRAHPKTGTSALAGALGVRHAAPTRGARGHRAPT
jgi:hypothetical protein